MLKKRKRNNELTERNIFKIAYRCFKHPTFKSLSFINKILYVLVQIMINYDIQNNIGKFKIGDTVRYNWKAKLFLGKYYSERKSEEWVIASFWSNGENWSSKNPEDSSSVFWVKKVK